MCHAPSVHGSDTTVVYHKTFLRINCASIAPTKSVSSSPTGALTTRHGVFGKREDGSKAKESE